MAIRYTNTDYALDITQLREKEVLSVGDKVKLASGNGKIDLDNARFYIGSRAICKAIYPDFFLFDTRKYSFCINKSDIYTGFIKVKKVGEK